MARRPADADQAQFLNTCTKVRQLMAEILKLKSKPGEKVRKVILIMVFAIQSNLIAI